MAIGRGPEGLEEGVMSVGQRTPTGQYGRGTLRAP